METEQTLCSVSYFTDQYSGRITLETGPIRRKNIIKVIIFLSTAQGLKGIFFSIQIGYQHFMYTPAIS